MNRPVDPSVEETKARMRAVLELQKAAQTRKGPPSAAVRKDRLTRCIDMLLTHKDDFVDAIIADFGVRSREMTLLTDVAAAVGPLKQARASLDKWMRPQSRNVTPAALGLLG
jgi:coniferyl-aldehyde dehydrogenase